MNRMKRLDSTVALVASFSNNTHYTCPPCIHTAYTAQGHTLHLLCDVTSAFDVLLVQALSCKSFQDSMFVLFCMNH